MFTKDFLRLIRRLFVLGLLFWQASALSAEPVRIGVLAFRPKAVTLEQWRSLAPILQQAIPERNFAVEAMDYEDLEARLIDGRLDFILTNPAHYVLLSHRHGLTAPLATVINLENDRESDVFGGVIFCLANRSDIDRLGDLSGKTVATPSKASFGGFLMEAYEMRQAGLNLERDLKWFATGMPHDRTVDAVLAGHADVGLVRTGVLESMISQGKLEASQIKIINHQNSANFRYLSTRSYPEWPFVASPKTDPDLARRVAGSLLLMRPHRIPGIAGFTIPADYGPVTELLKTMRVAPFDSAPLFTPLDIWQRYRGQLVILGGGIALIAALSLSLSLVNRRLHAERRKVKEQNDQLQASEFRWKLALEGADEGVWDWNIVSGETFFSPRWKSMIGYQPDEFADNFDAWHNALHPDDLERVLAQLNRYLTGVEPLYWVEFRMRCKDGSYKWILAKGITVAWTSAGQPQRMIGTHVDISHQKQIEQELLRSHDALLRSNIDLEQFAYSVSHDMRQPLRMVSGHLQFLARNLEGRLGEDERQNLEYALEGARRMDAMIVSLLEYSRVGRKTRQKARLETADVRDEALQFVQPLVEQHRAEIICDGEWPTLVASRDELSRLLQNLLANAIYYHKPDQIPRVQVHSETDGGLWRLSVSDNGIGIAPEYFERLFQFFSRLQARGRFDGTGMGLALCRRIVEHHDGRIWVDSAGEGLGTCFSFEIPIVRPPETGASA